MADFSTTTTQLDLFRVLAFIVGLVLGVLFHRQLRAAF